MLTAKDIMTAEGIITFTPDMDIVEAARVLIDKKINGAPVVEPGSGEKGVLVGVLSQTDLVAQQKSLSLPSVFTILDGLIPLSSPEKMEAEVQKIAAMTVGQAMSGKVVSAGLDTPVSEVASIMVDKGLHTIPVVDDDKRLLGVIGREDVLMTLLPKE
jgi:CBS domain-containing protein